MKKKANIFFVFSLFLFSCASKIQNNSAESFYLGKRGKDIIELSVKGYHKNRNKVIDAAERRAFEIILFRGLPNSEFRNPLFENEHEAKRLNTDFFMTFFNDKIYRNFIVSSSTSTLVSKNKNKNYSQEIMLSINVHSLRKYLEQNEIIKKFGL